MNPLTNMKNVLKLSERELESNSRSSWHDQYKDSAWIFVGGLPYDLTEGDIISVFSQYGEIVNINLIRAKDTGKSRGFCFICYEDQRSTILAVDNLNGIKILNRAMRVDHVAEYKVPKEGKKTDEETKKLYNDGCAPKAVTPVVSKQEPLDVRETIADQIESDIKLPARLPIYPLKQEPLDEEATIKDEKTKKKDKKKKKHRKSSTSSSDSQSSEDEKAAKSKREHASSNEKNKKEDNKNDKSSKYDRKTSDKRARSNSKERDTKSETTYRNRNDSFAYVPKRYRN